MEQLFRTVLDVSISASVLCVLILCARLIIGRKPTAILTLLGALLVVRLAIPVMIPSPLSAMNLFSGITAGQAEEPEPAVLHTSALYDIPVTQYSAPGPGAYTDNMIKAEPVNAPVERTAAIDTEPVSTPVEHTAAADAEPVNKLAPLSAMEIASIVWLSGIALLAACIAFSNVRFSRLLKKNRPYSAPGFDELLAECKNELGIKKDISTVQLSGINTAAVYGYFRPRLLISPSFGWLTREDKRYVLLHELAHIKRRDTLTCLLITALNVVYWFNPLVWAAFTLMRGDMEVMCDAAVLENTGDRKGYAATLINLAQSGNNPRPRLVTALFMRHSFNGLFISTDSIKRRIKMITRYKKNSALYTTIALMLVIAIAAVGCTGPAAATQSPEGNAAVTSGQQEQKLVAECTLDISTLPEDEARQANIEKAAGLLDGTVFPGVDETQTDKYSKYTWVDLDARLGKITADEGWHTAPLMDDNFMSKVFDTPKYTYGSDVYTNLDLKKTASNITDKTSEVGGGIELVTLAVYQAVTSAGMNALYTAPAAGITTNEENNVYVSATCGSFDPEKYTKAFNTGTMNNITTSDISLKIKLSDGGITVSLYSDKEVDIKNVYTSADVVSADVVSADVVSADVLSDIEGKEIVGWYALDFSAVADDEARVSNIKKAAEIMDGKVFPHWDASLTDDEEVKRNIGIPYALGPITEEAGWKNAAWTGWGPIGACIHEVNDTNGYFKQIEDQDIWRNVPKTQIGGGIEIAGMAFFRASQAAGMSSGSGYASPEDMELYLADKSKYPEPPEDNVNEGGGVDAVNDYASDLTLSMRVDGNMVIAAFCSEGPVQKADYTLPAHTPEQGDKTRTVTANYSLDLNSDWGIDMQFNIEKALAMLNGSVIKPGEQLSLNELLGDRNAENGWKQGDAIVDGAYSRQYGAGVGAVATALYNTALRAELDIVSVTHAAIKSVYVPGGLDATISSGRPDLVIKNPYDKDITIEANVTEDKFIDIYIYGPELGYTVDFFSEGNIGEAQPQKYVYNKTVAPDGMEIAPGDEYQWCESRGEETYKVYKVIKKPGDLQGDAEIYEMCTYPAIQGYTYVNGPEPK